LVKSLCAVAEAAALFVPVNVPGGKPLTAVPGDTPMSPLTVVPLVLVLVIDWPASTPKVHADAKSGAPVPPPLLALLLPHPTQRTAKHNPIAIRIRILFLLFVWLAGLSI
jgi:hypothetical protein